MKIIDLSQKIHTGMSVYPGDPEVSFERIQTIEKDEWNMSRLQISTHDGTHVNVPIHSKIRGKNLDNYTLENFIGKARIFEEEQDVVSDEGLIFSNVDITQEIAEKIVQIRPPFIGVPSHFEFDIEIERYLLENDIISFERLENTHKLPKTFIFHGAPLYLQSGDGSPVRAYALIDENSK